MSSTTIKPGQKVYERFSLNPYPGYSEYRKNTTIWDYFFPKFLSADEEYDNYLKSRDVAQIYKDLQVNKADAERTLFKITEEKLKEFPSLITMKNDLESDLREISEQMEQIQDKALVCIKKQEEIEAKRKACLEEWRRDEEQREKFREAFRELCEAN